MVAVNSAPPAMMLDANDCPYNIIPIKTKPTINGIVNTVALTNTGSLDVKIIKETPAIRTK